MSLAGKDAAGFAALEVADIAGISHRVPAAAPSKVTVLLFLTHDCPIANAYAPEINRLCADYSARQVAFCLIQVDPALSAGEARAHAREYGFRAPVVLDPEHRLVKRADARVTPQAVVLKPDGTVVYRGRIDNLYPALGKRRATVTERDLRAALDAVLSGRPVPKPVTQPVGCFIPTLKSSAP